MPTDNLDFSLDDFDGDGEDFETFWAAFKELIYLIEVEGGLIPMLPTLNLNVS